MSDARAGRLIARLFVAEFLYVVPFFALGTLVTVDLARGGTAPALIGVIASAGWIGILCAALALPLAVRRIDRRTLFHATSVAGVAVIPLLATGRPWLVAVALWTVGIAGGVRWVASEAWLAQLVAPDAVGKAIGGFETMIGATIVCGPALLAFTGFDGIAPYATCAALATAGVAVLLGAPLPADSVDAARAHDARDGPIASLVRTWRAHRPWLVAAFLGGVMEAGIVAVLPVQAVQLGATAGAAALLVSTAGAGSLLLQLPLGALSDRIATARLQRACAVLTLLAGVALFAVETLPALHWPIAFVFGGFGGGLFTLSMVAAGRSQRGPALIEATAGLVFAYNVGSSAGPMLAGAALDAGGAAGLAAVMVGLAVVGVGGGRER
ncbi:MAG: MFS transporter [Burkholderiales bacterium]|nr:MFS transporter [Burkholderiales bacterium]